MKKIFVTTLCLIMLALPLTGCAKESCWWCGEEKYCGTVTVLNEEVPVCRACQKEMEDIREDILGE